MALGKFDDIMSAYQAGYESNTPVSKLDTTSDLVQEQPGYGEEGVSDLAKEYLARAKQPEPISSAPKLGGQSGDLMAGIESGVEGMKGLYYGVKSLGQHVIGDEEGFKESAAKFKATEEKAAEINKGRVSSIGDVRLSEAGGFSRALDYTQNMLGNAIPSILTSIGSAIIGGAVGGATGNAPGAIVGTVGGALGKGYVQRKIAERVAGLTAKKVSENVARNIATKKVNQEIGASIGMLATGYAMGLGDIYNETRDENEKGNIIGSFLGAIPYAALDAVTEIGIMGRLGKANAGDNILARYAKAIAADATKEGATESAQEALLIAEGIASGKEYTSEDILERLGNSFAGGAIAGGAMGAGGTAVTADPLDNASKIAGRQKEINDRIENLAKAKEIPAEQEIGDLFKESPKVRNLFLSGQRLTNSVKSAVAGADPELVASVREGYDTKIEAALADLNRIANEQKEDGTYTTQSELEREAAKDAISRLTKMYTTTQEETRARERRAAEDAAIEEQFMKDMAGEQPTPAVTETTVQEVPVSETKQPTKKSTRRKQVRGTQQQQTQVPEAQVAPTAPQETVQPVTTPTPTPTTTQVQETPVEPPVAPQTDPLTVAEDRLSAIRNAAQKVQQPTQEIANGQEVQGQVQETPTEVKLPSNAYGNARGTGYASSTLSAPAKKTIAKLYGENWEQEGSMQQNNAGKWFYVPNDPNTQPNVPGKKSKREVGRTKVTIPENTPWTAKRVDRRGNITKDDLFAPVTLSNAQGTFQTTSNFKMVNGKYEVQLQDGTWVDPEVIGFKTQEQLRNNWSLGKSAPVAQAGQLVTEIQGATQEEQAIKEADQAVQIEREKQAAKQTAAKQAKQIPVPYTKEDLDWLVEKIKEARQNKANRVKDNIKKELDQRFGTRTKYKEYENMALLYLQDIIVPQETQVDQENQAGTVQGGVQEGQEPVQTNVQETSSQETQTDRVLQTPEVVNLEEPIAQNEIVKEISKSKLDELASNQQRLTKYLTEDYYFPDSNSYLDPETDTEIEFGSKEDTIEARKRALAMSDPAFYNSIVEKPTHRAIKQTEDTSAVAEADDFEVGVDELKAEAGSTDYTRVEAIDDNMSSITEWNLTPYAQDMETQAIWLDEQAKELGFNDIQDLLEKDISTFVSLSGQWRDLHPDVSFSLPQFREFVQANFNNGEDRVAVIRRFEQTANNFIRKAKERNPEVTFKVYLTGREMLADMKANNWSLNVANENEYKYARGYNSRTHNQIGIVLGNHYSQEDVLKTLMHELVGHRGMEGMFGDKWELFALRTWNTNKKIAERAYQLVGHYLKDANGYMPPIEKLTDAQKYTLISEYVAKKSELYSDPNYVHLVDARDQALIKRVFAYIKHLLRSFNVFQVTDRDIVELLQMAYKNRLGSEGNISNQQVAKVALAWNSTVLKDTNVVKVNGNKLEIGNIVSDGWDRKAAGTHTQYREAAASIDANPTEFANKIKEPEQNITEWQRILQNDPGKSQFFGPVRKYAQRLNDKINAVTSKYTDAFGTLRGKEQAKVRQRKALGYVESVQRETNKFANIVWHSKKLTEDQRIAILKAWESGAVANGSYDLPFLNAIQKKSLENLSEVLGKLQDHIVTSNYTNIPEEVLKKISDSRGAFIHQDYLSTLDKSFYGKGWLPSSLDWLKKKKVTGEAQKVDKAGILDSEYAITNTINLLAHDMAMLQMQENLIKDSENLGLNWVLESDSSKIEVDGVKYTLSQLRKILNDFNMASEEQSTLGYTDEAMAASRARKDKILQAIKDMQPAQLDNIRQIMWQNGGEYSKLDENGKVIPGSEKQITDEEAISYRDDNYVLVKERNVKGPLKWKYVDKRLHNVLVNESKALQEDTTNWVGRTLGLGQGSLLSRATSHWKAHMTVGNLAYWPRAVMGSAFNMDMASDTNSLTLTQYVGQELYDAFGKPEQAKLYGGKSLLVHAINQGVFSTGYSTAELYAVRDHLKRKGGLEMLKKETAKANPFGMMGAMYQMMTNGYYEVFKKLSDANVNIDGVFKLALMRDYLEIHAKQNGFKNGAEVVNRYQKEDPAKVEALMRNAAAYAGKGIIEYHDVPGWVKTLRTVPLGGPFLTFNFKMLGIMQRAMIARPHKLLKYYVLGGLIIQRLLAGSDWGEDELEEAMNNLPLYMRNKSSVFILPFKNDDGQVHYMDMSYTLPHSFIVDAVLNIADPIPGEGRTEAAWNSMIQTTGMFGSPVMTALTVLKTPNHTDPFTGRDLFVKGDAFENNLRRYGSFAWNLAMPPWLHKDTFDVGTGGGIISDAFNANYKDEFGKDKNPFWTTDFASLSGINVKAFRPEDQKIRNQRYFGFKIRELQTQRSRLLKKTNLSREDKVKSITDINKQIKELNEQKKKMI